MRLVSHCSCVDSVRRQEAACCSWVGTRSTYGQHLANVSSVSRYRRLNKCLCQAEGDHREDSSLVSREDSCSLEEAEEGIPVEHREQEACCASTSVEVQEHVEGGLSESELSKGVTSPTGTPSVHGGLDGYLLTLVAVVSGVLGRLSAQELRYDAARLFRNQEKSRLMNAELRQKRQEWKEQEEVRLAAEQKRRVEEVSEKARKEADRQKKLQEKYEKEAKEEQERKRREIEASRKEYEEQQRKLDEEYQARLQKEKEALEEARRVEKEWREEEERLRQLELQRKEEEARQKKMAEIRAMEEASASRMRAREEAKKEMSTFAVRLQGSVTVAVPPAGTVLPGPLEQQAKARLTVEASSLMGGPVDPVEKDYASMEDMIADAPSQISGVMKRCADAVLSALQLQKMSGEGPLTLMESPEANHWMSVVSMRSTLMALGCLDSSTSDLQGTGSLTQSFECRTESGVLPEGHPLSYQNIYDRLLDRIIDDASDDETITLFMESMEYSNDKLYKGIRAEPTCLSRGPKNLGVCLEVAHFVDRSLYTRPSKESDAPAWFEMCAEFTRRRLNQSFAGSPPDSLMAHSSLITQILGSAHPVSQEIMKINEQNISNERKNELIQKEKAQKALLAAKLLEEEWPEEEELRRARAKERESKTPVTERIWALKNVAASLSIGSPGEVSRARKLLEQAVLLKQEMCGGMAHPATFPEVLSLLRVIKTRSDWKNDASGVASLFLKISLNICEGYLEIDDNLSTCLVLECCLREGEDVAGLRNNVTLRCVKLLESVSSRLSDDENRVLVASRAHFEDLETFLNDAFTDELGAYQDGTEIAKCQLWDSKGPNMLGNLSEQLSRI